MLQLIQFRGWLSNILSDFISHVQLCWTSRGLSRGFGNIFATDKLSILTPSQTHRTMPCTMAMQSPKLVFSPAGIPRCLESLVRSWLYRKITFNQVQIEFNQMRAIFERVSPEKNYFWEDQTLIRYTYSYQNMLKHTFSAVVESVQWSSESFGRWRLKSARGKRLEINPLALYILSTGDVMQEPVPI